MKRVLILSVGLLLSSISVLVPRYAEAQWQLLSHIDAARIGGAFAYKSGVFWAGNVTLYKSTDSCKTWVQTGPIPTFPILGIDFYNQLSGAYILQFGEVYITKDGGRTWTLSTTIPQDVTSIRFGTNPFEIYVGTESPGVVWMTHDGGTNWTEQSIVGADWVQDFVNQPDGSTLAFTSNLFQKLGTIYRTRDHGATWAPLAGSTNADSWSLAIDSCDLKTMYVVNEQSAGPTEDRGILWVTRDGGTTWSNSLMLGSGDLAGSIAVGAKAAFVPTTTAQGIMRTTDHGATWTSIGGPPSHLDCREIVALNDNVVYAIDDLGDVFVTKNSGGDSLSVSNGQPLMLSTNSLFSRDTLPPCGSVSATVLLEPPPCGRAFVGSIRVTGPDSAFYAITHSPPAFLGGPDSIVLYFSPIQGRQYTGQLVITLTDGTTFIVTLGGSATEPISISTSDVPVRVLGEESSVPITIRNAGTKQDCDVQISYDTAVVVYDGTKTVAGRPVNETIVDASSRVLHFQIGDFVGDSIAAVALFRYYPMHDSTTYVQLDSLIALGIGAACQSVEPPLKSKLSYSIGCGSPTLSHYLRYAKLPQLTIAPNPASHHASLYSDRDYHGAKIELLDALGRTLATEYIDLMQSDPYALPISTLEGGTFYVRVNIGGVVRTLRLVRLK